MATKVKPNRSESGQSLMELAISLILILSLLAGAIDLGRAFFTYSALRDAAQEGAAFGSLYPADTEGIIQRAISASNPDYDWDFNANLNLTRLYLEGQIDINTQIVGGACLGGTIIVTVTYTQFPTGFLAMVLGNSTMPLRATINDTILRPNCP
jgi:hypothetical protein